MRNVPARIMRHRRLNTIYYYGNNNLKSISDYNNIIIYEYLKYDFITLL